MQCSSIKAKIDVLKRRDFRFVEPVDNRGRDVLNVGKAEKEKGKATATRNWFGVEPKMSLRGRSRVNSVGMELLWIPPDRKQVSAPNRS